MTTQQPGEDGGFVTQESLRPTDATDRQRETPAGDGLVLSPKDVAQMEQWLAAELGPAESLARFLARCSW